MLDTITHLFGTGFNILGLVVLLIGVFMILGAVVGGGGAGGFIRGGVLILIGSWIAGLAGFAR